MAQVLLLHHALGRTDGLFALADRIAAAGHDVHTPDLYDGRSFTDVEEGVAFARSLGDTLAQRADAAADALPPAIVLAGWSLGVMQAQRIAQSRPETLGALLLEAFVAPEAFGEWPAGLPAQVHGMSKDPWFAGDGDLAAAEEVAAQHGTVEVFGYPGDQHLFLDAGLPSYDGDAADLAVRRIIEFLDDLDEQA